MAKCSSYFKITLVNEIIAQGLKIFHLKKNRHRTISQRLIDDNFYPVITDKKYLHGDKLLKFIKI